MTLSFPCFNWLNAPKGQNSEVGRGRSGAGCNAEGLALAIFCKSSTTPLEPFMAGAHHGCGGCPETRRGKSVDPDRLRTIFLTPRMMHRAPSTTLINLQMIRISSVMHPSCRFSGLATRILRSTDALGKLAAFKKTVTIKNYRILPLN